LILFLCPLGALSCYASRRESSLRECSASFCSSPAVSAPASLPSCGSDPRVCSSVDVYRLIEDESALDSVSHSLRQHKPSPTSGYWWTAAGFIAFNHLVFLLIPFFSYPSSSLSPSSPWYHLPFPSFSLVMFTLFQSFLNLLGITAGYHRLWSHRSYSACFPLRLFLSIIGLQSFQGSISWWVKRHRLHHRFTDTPFDPYDSTRGLFYSHIGWLFSPPPHFSKLALIGMKDLESDPVVRWQKKWLLVGYILFGAILPAIQGWWICGSAIAGIVWIGFVARIISWHGIWSINSVSHAPDTFPTASRAYSLSSSAVHVPLFAILQNGEGHHNYHHCFPTDYRHGIGKWDYDPTKWFIQICLFIGIAWGEKKTQQNRIKMAKWKVAKQNEEVLRKQTKLPKEREKLQKNEMGGVRKKNEWIYETEARKGE